MDKSTAISIFEKMDEEQIVKADKAVKQAMVYTAKVNGEQTQEITFVGIKHLILQLAVKDNPLEILESRCELQKDDPDDRSTWHWRAYKKFRNINTRLESDGRSECPFLDNGRYDAFAQRKADSKAERNAQRKQIPELVIKEFLKSVNSDQIQDVEKANVKKETQLCTCPPDRRIPSETIRPDGHLECRHCSCKISSLVSEEIIKNRGK